MSEPTEDSWIRDSFHELRHEDERSVPSFRHTRSAALSNHGTQDHRRAAWRLAAAIMVLGVLGAGLWIETRQTARHRLATAPSDHTFAAGQSARAVPLSEWHSPTESLLHVPGEQLFKGTPRLDESVVIINAAPVFDQEEQS